MVWLEWPGCSVGLNDVCKGKREGGTVCAALLGWLGWSVGQKDVCKGRYVNRCCSMRRRKSGSVVLFAMPTVPSRLAQLYPKPLGCKNDRW